MSSTVKYVYNISPTFGFFYLFICLWLAINVFLNKTVNYSDYIGLPSND